MTTSARRAWTRELGDLSGDGSVNFVDFLEWRNNATPAALALAGFAVPEPSALAVLAIGVCGAGSMARGVRG